MPPKKTPSKTTSLSKNSHPKKRQFLDGKGVLLLPCYPFIHPTIGPYIILSIHPSNHRSISPPAQHHAMDKSIHHASMQSLIHPTFLPHNRPMTVMTIKFVDVLFSVSHFLWPNIQCADTNAESRRLSLRSG